MQANEFRFYSEIHRRTSDLHADLLARRRVYNLTFHQFNHYRGNIGYRVGIDEDVTEQDTSKTGLRLYSDHPRDPAACAVVYHLLRIVCHQHRTAGLPVRVIAISINSAAYIAEIIRSGIQAVDKGQMEAARSIGMSKRLAMQKIIYPQAVKNILPALGNEVATLIKETSIVSVLGLRDLMFASDIVRGATFMPFFPLVIVAVIYFILTTSVSKLVDMLERKMKQSD